MFKLNAILINVAFVFSSLTAVTVNFPLNQPVTFKSNISYVKTSDDRYTRNRQELEAVLIPMSMDSQLVDIEVTYQNIVNDYQHDNDNLMVSIEYYFDSKNPGTGDTNLQASWDKISQEPQLLTVTPGSVLSSEKTSSFFTFKHTPLFQLNLIPYFSLNGRELAVGDTFQVTANTLKWEYRITNIRDDRVYYNVTLISSKNKGIGSGFWNKENGFKGQMNVHLFLNGASYMAKFISE